MLKRSPVSRFTAGLLLGVAVYATPSIGLAAIWDQTCEKAISSLGGTQQRIQITRGELVAHDMQRVSSTLFGEGEWTVSKLPESKSLFKEQEMSNLLELFNVKLKEFSENCLKDQAA